MVYCSRYSYAIGLVVGGLIVLASFGVVTNIVIGLLGLSFRILLEILLRC